MLYCNCTKRINTVSAWYGQDPAVSPHNAEKQRENAEQGGIYLFDIRLEGKQPIYEQLCEKIAALITSGVLPAGERLPTVRETAKSLGINPNTVQRAYNRLENEGFIYSVPAKGSYVSESSSAADAMLKKVADELKDSMAAAKNAGMAKKDAEKLLESVWA